MKNYFKLIAVSLSIVILTINACKKDEDLDPNSTSTSSNLFGSTVSITVKGKVYDVNGTAISGALVKSGNVNVTTDVNGVFILNNIAANQKLGCVTVEKAGYFKGVRSFVPKTGGNELQIQLLSKSIDGTINSSTGGTVSIPNGSVTLPTNGVTLNNSAYSGNVNVAIKHFDPTSANFNDAMPGSLVGVDNSTVSGLTSYGMLGVELTDNNGQLLHIANGKTATLTFKVPTSLQASAPASIDLWSLDETKGYWKKEGVANLVNNEYVGEVSHFSFWNCDVPSNFVYINGQVINSQTQQPIQGATVTVSSTNYGAASDYTNSQGQYSGYVPNGVGLSITVSVNCSGSNTMVYTGSLPTMSANTSIATIAITLPGQTVLSGTVVDCNNQPLSNSYIVVNNQAVFTNNGQFSASVCGSSCTVQAFGSNPWVSGQSQQISLQGGTQSVGSLVVCNPGGSTVTDIDGNVYSTVIIGNQEWMQENLKTTHYKNGVLIPTSLNDSSWTNTTVGAYSFYNNSSSNNIVYGNLYNWYAVADPNGLCPTGWHVPADWEWNTLVKYLDSSADTTCMDCNQNTLAGGALKEIGLSHWASPNTGATNSSGFSGLAGGIRDVDGTYYQKDSVGIWWCSNAAANYAYQRVLFNYSSGVQRTYGDKPYGFSVRCVKD